MLKNLTSLATKIWNIIAFILPILEGVGRVIMKVEELEPDDDVKRGKDKKEVVKEIILAIYDLVNDAVGEDLPISREKLAAFLDNVIDILVKIYNVFGSFSELGES